MSKKKTVNKFLEETVNGFALAHGWKKGLQKKNTMGEIMEMAFEKNKVQLHYHFRTMICFTSMWHPRLKKNTLLKRGMLSMAELEKVFIDPRSHTNKGEYLSIINFNKKKKTKWQKKSTAI